jgi:hypothetical protein
MAFSKIKADATELDLATQVEIDLKSPLASPTFTGTVAGVTATHVGLGNVDNTTDALKPVSTATAASITTLETASASIRQDISILALREAVTENRVANNLPNSFIDHFQDSTGVGTFTTAVRDATEFVGVDLGGSVGALANGLVAHWGTADAITRTVSSSLLTLQHDTSPDSDDGTWSYGTPQTARATTPYKFSANVAFSVQFKPHSDHNSYNPYFAITDATYTGEKSSNDSSFNTNTWMMKWAGTSASSTFAELGSTVKTFTDSGISSASKTYRFDRSGLGVLKAYQDGVLFHTFADVNTQEMQMWFSGAGGTGTGEVRELKYVEGTGASATGTIIGNTNVPSSAQTKVSGVMLYKDNAGTATLGTDIIVSFTCNGGTNWTDLVLADMTAVTPVFSTGIKMVKLAEKTCTSGSDIRYKVVWANQGAAKETQLHGIGLNY